MLIAVDFDGTIVEHEYPKIGKVRPFAFETLLTLQAEGHKLVLWTSREGDLLDEAVEFCHSKGLDFYAINSETKPGSLFEKSKTRKIVADIYIDDRNLGGLPDWGTIYEMVTGMKKKSHGKHSRGGFSIFRRRR